MQDETIRQATEERDFWHAKSLVTALAGAGLATLAPSALAATYTVTNLNDSGAGSLRQAIIDANGNGGTDTINFSGAGASGTITLTSGQLNIYDPVIINGPGASSLTISGNNSSRIFDITRTTSISGLTLTNGSGGEGGAITFNYLWDDLTITDSVIYGNYAYNDGGGVHVQSATNVTISNTRIENNTSRGSGGGVDIDTLYLGGSLTVDNTTISGNKSDDKGGGLAFWKTVWPYGGPYSSGNNYATHTISNSVISNNQSGNDGGGLMLYDLYGSVSIDNCVISGNTANGGDGGGVYLYDAASGRDLYIRNSTISGNKAYANYAYYNYSRYLRGGNGGGVFIDDGMNNATHIVNSTIYGNYAEYTGGAIAAYYGTHLLNSTISGNSAGGTADGVYFYYDGYGSPLDIENTILAGNGTDLVRNSNARINARNSLIQNGSGAINGTNTANITGVSANLGPLANNGGPLVGAAGATTQMLTMLPTSISLAINKGSNSLASGLSTDQRGAGYPRVQDGTVDIGAIEGSGGLSPVSQPIPTLSEWGLLSTASLLGLWGAGALQRRRAPVRKRA